MSPAAIRKIEKELLAVAEAQGASETLVLRVKAGPREGCMMCFIYEGATAQLVEARNPDGSSWEMSGQQRTVWEQHALNARLL